MKVVMSSLAADLLYLFIYFLTLAVFMCWETLSKLQLSSASLGSTTSRQAGPLMVIRMIAWSLTLSTRRLISSSSSCML